MFLFRNAAALPYHRLQGLVPSRLFKIHCLSDKDGGEESFRQAGFREAKAQSGCAGARMAMRPNLTGKPARPKRPMGGKNKGVRVLSPLLGSTPAPYAGAKRLRPRPAACPCARTGWGLWPAGFAPAPFRMRGRADWAKNIPCAPLSWGFAAHYAAAPPFAAVETRLRTAVAARQKGVAADEDASAA